MLDWYDILLIGLAIGLGKFIGDFIVDIYHNARLK